MELPVSGGGEGSDRVTKERWGLEEDDGIRFPFAPDNLIPAVH